MKTGTRNARRANRLSWIVVEGQASGFSCLLVDFSPDSAIISLQGLLAIPDRFHLYVEPDGIRAACKVVERRSNNVRVSFEELAEGVHYRKLKQLRRAGKAD